MKKPQRWRLPSVSYRDLIHVACDLVPMGSYETGWERRCGRSGRRGLIAPGEPARTPNCAWRDLDIRGSLAGRRTEVFPGLSPWHPGPIGHGCTHVGEPVGSCGDSFLCLPLATFELGQRALASGYRGRLGERAFTRPALGISMAWALVIWWLGESFGMLPSGIALLGRRPRSGPAVCDVRCDGVAAPSPS
jgi:hypothetical protein